MTRTVERISLHLTRPMITAHGSIDVRRIAAVSVTDGNFTGHGEASTLPGFGLETQDEAERELDAWAGTGDVPTTPAAATAVACAAVNLEAAQSQVSLASSLAGGPVTGELRCQAVIGDGDVEASRRDAAAAVEGGYEAVKVKVAAGPASRDIERVRAIREAIGPSTAIRLDANGGWALATATAVLRTLSDADIEFVEEPTRSPTEFREIAATTGHTIALDEHAQSADVIDGVAGSGIDVIIVKPAVLGGPTAAHTTALGLLNRGLRVVVSSFMDGPIGLDAAVQVAAALPTGEIHGLATAGMFDDAFPAHLTPIGGRLVLG